MSAIIETIVQREFCVRRKALLEMRCLFPRRRILAAREDDAAIAKVCARPPTARSSSNPLTKTKVGRVPDRGGRPFEQAPPPPEMPSWQKRQDGGGGGRGGGGGYRDPIQWSHFLLENPSAIAWKFEYLVFCN